MKWLNGSKIRVLLIVFVAAIVISGGRANADFTFGTPTNLGPTVNTVYTEVGPSISFDGLSLYFSGHHDYPFRPGGYGGADLWVTKRATMEDDWSTPVNLGPIVNSSAHDMEPSISADGLSLYFNTNRPGGYGGFDIWVTKRPTKDADWGIPVNLGPTVNSLAPETEPCISTDGLMLFFDSNRPGGFGDYDLYITTRPTIDDNWSQPVNLGPTVNSFSLERGASISVDGLALFFCSYRSDPSGPSKHSDLWVTTRATIFEPWATPVNLGPSVNSSAAEDTANISADGLTLFFKSNRSGGVGGQDIWQAPIIPIVDFNGDGTVDIADMVILIDNWGTNETLCDIGPMPWGDGVVDIEDLKVFISYWEQENLENSEDDQ